MLRFVRSLFLGNTAISTVMLS